MKDLLENIYREAKIAAKELCEKAKLQPGQIVIIGCSSSEVGGNILEHTLVLKLLKLFLTDFMKSSLKNKFILQLSAASILIEQLL